MKESENKQLNRLHLFIRARMDGILFMQERCHYLVIIYRKETRTQNTFIIRQIQRHATWHVRVIRHILFKFWSEERRKLGMQQQQQQRAYQPTWGVWATVSTKIRTRLGRQSMVTGEPVGSTTMSASGLSLWITFLASSTLSPTTSGHDVLGPPHSGAAVAVELIGCRSRIETANQLMTII